MPNTTWKRLSTVLLLSGAVALGACSDDDGGDDDAADGGDDTTEETTGDDASGEGGITAEGFAFNDATVAAGATVTVTNADGATHTVTADDGEFDVSVSGGESGEFTAPSEPGDYAFHCEIHTSMTGTLTVE
jgi:plastocyanin